MRPGRLKTSVSMVSRMLLRRRIVIALMILIPTVFALMVLLTTSEDIIPFRLASVSGSEMLEIEEESISVLFMIVASVGFLASFLALNLVQKYQLENKRLVICGYRPAEVILSSFTVLLVLVVFLSLFASLILSFFFSPENYFGLILGLILAGFVYGGYGLLVGSLLKGELEGILFIVLLANIDAGWLQNPLFYEGAQNQAIIRYLPAYFPSQVAISASFSDHGFLRSALNSILYSAGFIILANLLFHLKTRRIL